MRLLVIALFVISLWVPTELKAQFQLLDSSPRSNAISVPANQVIILRFSSKIDSATVLKGILLNSNIRGTLLSDFNVTDSLLTITPLAPFKPFEEITITLLPTLLSLSGTPLSPIAFIRFITATQTSPIIPPAFKSFPLSTSNVLAMAKADMDGDGDIDIIYDASTSIPFSTNLFWLENDGAGNFNILHTIMKNTDSVLKILPFDIDQDSDMDVVVASVDVGVLLFINDGSESFISGTISGTSGSTSIFSLDVIDFDLNGLYDVIYTTPSEGLIVLYNQGGSGFTKTVISNSFGTQSKCVDIDNDGDIDIVQHDDYSLIYLLNNQGSFDIHKIIDNGPNQLRDMYVVDLNNDHNLDIILSKVYSMEIWMNGPTLQFTSKVLIPNVNNSGADYYYVTFGDFDGDGDEDIIYPEADNYFMSLNDGAANFSKTKILNEQNSFYPTSNILTADFDGDGDLDFASTSTWFKNATFAEVYPFSDNTPVGFKPLTNANADWGDYDNDGDLDVLMIGNYTGVPSTILYQNQNGVLVEQSTGIPGYQFGSCDWGDFDLDGDLDILITGENSQGNSRTVIYVNSNGSFTLLSSSMDQLNWYGSEARWADFNNDGKLDIAIVGQNSSELYQSLGDGNFKWELNLPTSDGQNIAIADYDNDGDLDIACNYPLSVLRNDGDWAFNPAKGNFSLLYGKPSWSDMDNDGDLDLIVSVNTSFGIYQNQDSLFVGSAYNQVLPQFNVTSSPGDYNNDGLSDLIASTGDDASSYTPALTLLKNDGTGHLINSNVLLPAVGSWVTTWADYDLDHALDILVEGKLLQNNTTIKNTTPTPPTFLQVDSIYNNAIFFHWGQGNDIENGPLGLSYQIYAGTQSLHQDIVNSNSDLSTGFRRIAELGNVKGLNTRIENLHGGNYFLGVQSIDVAFEGSQFSNEANVSLIEIKDSPGSGCLGYSALFTAYPSGNYLWQVIGGTIVSGQGTDSITVNWNKTGMAYVKVSNQQGAKSTLGIMVDDKRPLPIIAGDTTVCTGLQYSQNYLQQYTVSDTLSHSIEWAVIGNGPFNDNHTNTILVNWVSPGLNKVVAIAYSKNKGCATYDTLNVSVDQRPVIPVILPDYNDPEICHGGISHFSTTTINPTWKVRGGTMLFDSAKLIGVQWPSLPSNVVVAVTLSQNSTHDYCTVSDSLLILINSVPPKPTLTVTQQQTTYTLLSSTSPAGSYKWFYNGSQIYSGSDNELITRVSGIFQVEVFATQGCGEFSDSVKIVFPAPITEVMPSNETSFDVYPLPTDKMLSIDLADTSAGEMVISIYSVTGQLVKQVSFQKVDSKFHKELDISELSSGMYILTLNSPDSFYSHKIIKR